MSSAHRRSAGNVTHTPGELGLFAAVSIGVGGMIGAGIFSILGVVAGVSGTALPVSFVIGGGVALLAAYSYLKLGIRYPSVGGASQFLVEEFGDGLVSGGLNIFQYLAYVIAIALYARGFAGYAATFFPNITGGWIDEEVQRLLRVTGARTKEALVEAIEGAQRGERQGRKRLLHSLRLRRARATIMKVAVGGG